MTLDEYQKGAMAFAVYPREQGLHYAVLLLAEEAGEVAGKLSKSIRDGHSEEKLKEAIIKELGDVLWAVSAVAKELDVPLNAVGTLNLIKLGDRLARNMLQGSGDNR